MAKVIVLLVDSLGLHSLTEALTHRSVPALQFLHDHAFYTGKAATVYPTMTATVDSTLLTGEYPDRHRVPGLVHYDPNERRMINYLNGLLTVAVTGIRKSVLNNLRMLNDRHLNPETETLYEALAVRRISSTSINALVHRGPYRHRLRLPFWLRWWNDLFATDGQFQVSGPDRLIIGNLIVSDEHLHMSPHLVRPWRAYGVNDGLSVQTLAELIRSGRQSDFSLVYLPDLDHAMHRKNPAHTRDAMMQLDRHICTLLDAFGDWQSAVRNTVWVLISDHGQVQIAEQAIGQINLDQMLAAYRRLPLRSRATSRHQLAVANNERMAYVYVLDHTIREEVTALLCSEARFDVIARKEVDWIEVYQGGSRRSLRFSRAVSGGRIDQYGICWHLEGDWRTLDLCEQDGTIRYGEYPDALARIYGALYAHEQDVLLVNARPRYEIRTATYPKHKGGGAHGSLHRSESEVPLWLVGGPESLAQSLKIPAEPRMIDIKPLILSMFDILRPQEVMSR